MIAALRPGLAGDRAGLRAGDRFWRWEQGSASGALASPFDLAEVEIEYGPRGPVRFVGARGQEPLSVSLTPDAWGIDASALQDDAAWRLLAVAKEAAARGQIDAAVAAVEDAVRAAAARPVAQAHLLAFLGETLREADRLPAAAQAFDRALAARARAASGPLAAFQVAEGISRLGEGQRERHERLLRDAIAAHERLAPDSLALVRLLDALGWMLGGKEQRALAERALGMAERLAPETTLHARVLFSVAWGADERRALGLLKKAVAIQEGLEPESRQTGLTVSFLGRYLDYTGDSARALELERRALRLLERIAPGSGEHGHAVNNLALYWSERGDLVQAEALYRQALAIEQRRQPEGFGVARGHYNLGRVLLLRRENGEAETHLRHAWDMTQAHGYGRGLAGRVLSALGRIQHDRGQLPAAEATLRRALEMATRVEPAQQMNVRERLAAVLVDRGRLAEAEALYRQNLEEAAAGDIRFSTATRHAALASFVERRGDLDTAARHHRTALDLRRQQVPGTMDHAESAHALGAIARRQGRRSDALALFREAVEALEQQGRHLGGAEEARAEFRAHYQEYYRDLEELLLEMGHETDAFQILERSRAHGLPALLATRDVGFAAHVPDELERERRAAEADYDRVFAALTASPGGGAGEKLKADHDAARHRMDEVRARIRSASPRASAMREPEPLDLAGVRRALGPGTLLLAFSLGTAQSRVYAVGPGPHEFAVLPLAATRAATEEAVRSFRETIATRRSSALRVQVALRSAALSRMLLAPAAGPLARAERLVIVPDGPLHLLPFAALRDPSRPTRYLVEAVALHTVSSMTLHAILAEGSAAQDAVEVIGFGDPAYGDTSGDEPRSAALERARRAGLRLEPLPATRGEVEVLRSLSPAARVWLGTEATEERAKSLGPDARVIHFACHGFVDETLPLESGLALSTAGADGAGENGFLQAWEVFETIRVDADLVTLSACDTALGKDVGGEGLLGLTWAFQYAGARSVLASLWHASDASTAELMKAFYARLAAGATKAEALRRAQIGMLRKDASASPYYWAAFTLIGAGP